jgi:hypothetical protein
VSKILAIDPGPRNSAFIVWDGEILDMGIIPSEDLLGAIWKSFHRGRGINSCIIESIASYGMAVGEEVFTTCRWIGRYQERWFQYSGEEAVLVPRLKIKLHHCKSAKANDSNIRTALVDRFGVPGTKKRPGLLYGVKKDIWSALAIATYQQDLVTSDKS